MRGKKCEVIQHIGFTQPDEFCEFKTCDIEMMKPKLPTHCSRISKIGERSSGQVVNHFNGVTIGEQSFDQMGSNKTCSTTHHHR
jgi:hypothetical protein